MEPDDLRKRRRELLFDVRKSVRYHDYRRKHYLQLQSIINFLGVVLGSAAFAALQQLEPWNRVFPAGFAVLSAIALVFRVTEKALLHYHLYQRFIGLEREFLDCSEWSSDTLDELENDKLKIEADEPSVYSALNRLCHNEILMIEGN